MPPVLGPTSWLAANDTPDDTPATMSNNENSFSLEDKLRMMDYRGTTKIRAHVLPPGPGGGVALVVAHAFRSGKCIVIKW